MYVHYVGYVVQRRNRWPPQFKRTDILHTPCIWQSGTLSFITPLGIHLPVMQRPYWVEVDAVNICLFDDDDSYTFLPLPRLACGFKRRRKQI